jgi:phenylalanyl-tRNA synthetase beta chain
VRRDWRGAGERPLDFWDAKGAVSALLESLGIDAAWEPGEHASMHPGRTAAVRAGDRPLGHVGVLHPLVAERWELDDAVATVADLDLDAIGEAAAVGERAFAPFSAYPPVEQDLAVVVDEDVPATAVESAIRNAAGTLLTGLVLFDVYQGEQIGAGKKSLAWSLTFQAPDKTLTSEAVSGVRAHIVRALEREVGGVLR